MWHLVDDNEDTGFYLERYGKPLEHFKQRSDMIGLIFQQDRADYSLENRL